MRAADDQRQRREARRAAAAVLGAALALWSCATPAPQVEQREYDLANGFLHVEVSIPHAPPGRKPAVIGSLGDDERLLARGIAVARFRSHWEVFRSEGAEAGDAADVEPPAPARVGAWALAAQRPGIVGRSYFALIGATARSIVPAVVDLLAGLPEVDPERIAIAGSSTYGFVALEALRAEPRLAAGVVRVACADYRRFLRSSSLALNDDPRWLPGGELVLDTDYAAELAAREPLGSAADYPPRPLLMLNGARDPAVPEACARRSAEAFRDAYRAAGVSERFRFVLYPDAGHDLGPRAADEVLAWWERWLLGGLADAAADSPPL